MGGRMSVGDKKEKKDSLGEVGIGELGGSTLYDLVTKETSS